MTRREWIVSAGAASSGLAASPKPNVVLILTDQQYIKAIGATGNSHVRTPNIDRLAGAGTCFANSWCTNPVCSPARASLVTGCMPGKAGVDYLGQRLKPDVTTVGEAFRDAGYDTAWAGKWHLPAPFPGAQVANGPAPLGGDRGFDFLPFPMKDRSQIPFGDFTDEPIAEAAAAFLRTKRTRPFFLGVSLHNPHDICYWIANALPAGHPSSHDLEVGGGDLPPLPRNFAISSDEPEFISRCRSLNYFGGQGKAPTKTWDEARWRRYLYAYYRMTERVDRSVGLVLDALREARLEEDTLVVFTSDHGEGMGAHQWVMKLMLYEEPLSVPLIFRWKRRIPAGRVDRRTLASGMDVVPTLCDLAGIAPPKTMDGVSLRPALNGAGRVPRDSVFAQLAPAIKDRTLQGRAVRTERFKYVSFSWGNNPEMLFDLKADPGETRNLASSAKLQDELARHRLLLGRWLKATSDPYRQPS